MIKKSIAFLSLIATLLEGNAQKKYAANANMVQVNTSAGTWSLQRYGKTILKCIYTPNNATKNEYVGDAVNALPLLSDAPTINSQPNGEKVVAWRELEVKIDGEKLLVNNLVTLQPAVYGNGFKGFQFPLTKEEKIYGGGSRAIGLNRRGYWLNLYNAPAYGYSNGAENLNYSVPFLTSSNGYALLFDNPSSGYFDIGKTNADVLQYGAYSGELNCYIILGATPKEILTQYHSLTGTQPLPPRWALGNFMSRFGYTSTQQVNEIAASMQAAKIPFDAIIFDLFWFGDSIKATMGNLDWVNKEKWPNPKKMIQDFAKQNIKSILITEPFILESSKNYESSKPYLAKNAAGQPYELQDFYFGKGGIIDIFKTDAQNWFWQFYKKQMDIGVEGWWGDLGEPEKHPNEALHTLSDKGYNRQFSADEIHNVYGHTWTKMLYNQYKKHYPNKRLFSLNRSGFAGTQRYGIIPWSGDISRNWQGLQAQMPIMLGMSMSGVPYMHSDAGGFAFGEGDKELYIRWLQFSAYTPLFRPHGTALYEIDRNAFSFPSEPSLIGGDEQEMAKQIVLNRYRMLPYNYTLSYLQTTIGEPLAKPLFYQYPNDSTVAKYEDSYLWGNAILVAPIVNKGSTNRMVYLPKGIWYNGKHEKMSFAGEISVEASLAEIPIFYKGGSVVVKIPESKPITTTKDCDFSEVDVHIYLNEKNEAVGLLYEDDGLSRNSIESNKHNVFSFEVAIKKADLEIELAKKVGGYRTTLQKINWYLHGINIDKPLQVFVDKKSVEVNQVGKKSFHFVSTWDVNKKAQQISLVDYTNLLRWDDTRPNQKL